MNSRRQSDPTAPSANYGVINTGHMTGPVQAAAFSQNVTQTNNISPGAVEEARDSIQELRESLERLRGQHPGIDGALRTLDEISPRLDEPERDPRALRFMLDALVERCGGIPGVLAAAQLVQSTVLALLPAL